MATYVQQAQKLTSNTPATILFTSAQVQGDTNVIVLYWRTATLAVTSVTDTSGNVYTAAGAANQAQGMSVQIWYATNIKAAAASANTVTVVFSGSVSADIVGIEYSANGQLVVDSYVVGSGNSVSPATTSTGNALGADLLVAVCRMSGGTGIAAGSGWNQRATPSGNMVEDQVSASPGSYAATTTFTNGSAIPWNIVAAAFRFVVSSPLNGIETRLPPLLAPQLIASAASTTAPTPGALLSMASTDVSREHPRLRLLLGDSLPASGPTTTLAARTEPPPTIAGGVLRGDALPASGGVQLAPPTLPPPAAPPSLAKANALAPPGPLLVAGQTLPPLPSPPSVLRGDALPVSGGTHRPPSTIAPPTAPPSMFRGDALPPAGPLLSAPSTLPPPAGPPSTLVGSALPSPGALLALPGTLSPPPWAPTLVRADALPPLGALLFLGPTSVAAPNAPSLTAAAGAAAVSSTSLAMPPTTPVSTLQLRALLVRGDAVPPSAAPLVMGPTTPPTAYPYPSRIDGFSPLAITPATVLRFLATDAPPTLAGSLARADALPRSASPLAAPSTLPPPTLPGVVLRGDALPTAGPLLVLPLTLAPPAAPPVLAAGSALPSSSRSLFGAPTQPPPSPGPSLVRGDAMPVAGPLLALGPTLPPPTLPAARLAGTPPIASAFALTQAPTLPPVTTPAAFLFGGPLPLSGQPLAMPATERLDTPKGVRFDVATFPGGSLLFAPLTDLPRFFGVSTVGGVGQLVSLGPYRLNITVTPVTQLQISIAPVTAMRLTVVPVTDLEIAIT